MDPGLIAVLALSGGFFVIGLIGPLLAQLHLRQWREPTETDRESLETVLPPEPIDVARTVVVETVGDDSVEIAIRGMPGCRVLFLSDFVLQDLNTPTARALLAAETARARLLYREYQVMAATIAVALGTAAFFLVVPFELGFGSMLVAAFVLLTVGRWLQYRADSQAASVVGAGELADAFEEIANLHDVDLSGGGWRSYLEVQPSLGDRIERLRRFA